MSRVRLLSWIAIASVAGVAGFASPRDDAQQRFPAPEELGTVFGRVVDGETGVPVRFASVQVVRFGPTMGTASTMTGEDGTFVCPSLQPGLYFAAAATATHAPSFYSADATPVADPGSPMSLARGTRIGPIEIRLTRGAVIAGTITDVNGEPAAGVPIQIQQWPPVADPQGSLFYFIPRFPYSDADGHFRAFGLAPGDYLVSAGPRFSALPSDPAAVRRRKHQRVYFPGTTDPAAAVPVKVASGQEQLGIDVQLQVAALYKVSGKVDVPPGANVDHVWLRFVWAGRPVESDLPSTSGPEWLVLDMPPGNYWVVATATEPSLQSSEGRLWWAKTPLTIGSMDVSDVALTLQSSAAVNGRLAFEGDAAVSAYELGRWQVTLVPTADSTPLIRYPWLSTERVNAGAQFTIRNIMPGRYRLKATALTDTGTILSATLGGRPLPSLELEITPEMTELNDLVIKVRR
jgi:hypothetical protein